MTDNLTGATFDSVEGDIFSGNVEDIVSMLDTMSESEKTAHLKSNLQGLAEKFGLDVEKFLALDLHYQMITVSYIMDTVASVIMQSFTECETREEMVTALTRASEAKMLSDNAFSLAVIVMKQEGIDPAGLDFELVKAVFPKPDEETAA